MTRLGLRLAGLTCGLLCTLAAEAEEGTVADVNKAGAVADDGKDDTAAVQAAIDALAGKDGARLVFGKGRYDFFAGRNPRSKHAAMLFRKCKGLTVEGKDTTLLFHGLTAVMQFGQCDRVTVRNLTIDWERPPFSVGTVTAARGRSFDVKVFKEYPVTGGEPVQAFMEYDPKTRLPQRRGLDVYHQVKSTELIGAQELRLNLTRGVAVRPGMLLVLRHQVYRYNALSFRECSDVTVENVTVYTTPGMAVTGHRSKDFLLKNVQVRIRPGTNRLMSSTADAAHFNSCSGEIRILDCLFEGMGDDAVNVHGMWHTVRAVVDKHTVVTGCRNGWLIPPQPGHNMEFTDPKTILPYAEGRVKSVALDRKSKVHRIEFADALPGRLKKGHVLGNVSWAPKLHISGCTVRANRARGFLVQTRHAVIEKNAFEHVTGAGIHVTTDVGHWQESIGTRDVVIRGNTFEECNYGAAMAQAPINVFAHLPGWKDVPNPGVHRSLVIEGNTIRGTDNAAIFVSATDGATIRDNVIENCSRDRIRTSGKSAIYLMNTRNATVTGNRVADKRRGKDLREPLGIGPGCDRKTITVRDNVGF